MKDLLRILPLLLMIAACGGSKPTVPTTTEQVLPEPPAWVRQRPVSTTDYIGIGRAPARIPDAANTAKRNALEDLASEISVVVEANSLLHTLERRGGFDESFSSSVRTRTDAHLEGYEAVGSWTSDSEIWTYYRLSKQLYAERMRARKERAITLALDHHAAAKQADAKGDLVAAIQSDLRALLALRDHWNESDTREVDGRNVQVDQEVLRALRERTAALRMVVTPSSCPFEMGSGNSCALRATVTQQGKPVARMPISLRWLGPATAQLEELDTDAAGVAAWTFQARNVAERAGVRIQVAVDLGLLIGEVADRALLAPFLADLRAPMQEVPVQHLLPRVLVRANEQLPSGPAGDAGAVAAIKQRLTAMGYRLVERAADADLLFDLRGTIRSGGVAEGFHTAWLDLVWSYTDRRTNELLHQGSHTGKGVQLDATKAATDAYKRAATLIGGGGLNDVLPPLSR